MKQTFKNLHAGNRHHGSVIAAGAVVRTALIFSAAIILQSTIFGQSFEINGVEVRPFYESTPTGRVDQDLVPVTDRFNMPESSSAFGLSFSLGGPDRAPVPDDLQDVAFDRFVDLTAMREALTGTDAGKLADCALLLNRGEQVLHRRHRSGITAEQLMLKAVAVAIERKDDATIDRVAQAAVQDKSESVVTAIDAHRKLSGAARGNGDVFEVDLETVDPDTFADVQSWQLVISEAASMGDVVVLEALRESLSEAMRLTESQKSVLTERIEHGIEAAADPTGEPLRRLAASSRTESDRQSVRNRIEGGGWHIVWGKTIAAREYGELVAATYSGTLGAYFGYLLEENVKKMEKQMPGVGRDVLMKAIKQAMSGNQIVRVKDMGVKGGIATYRYWNVVTVKVPDGTEKYKIKGPLGSWTWGYRPKFKTVTKEVPAEPNNHQPYFGFRLLRN